jgi:cyanobactin maturation PatA/PatG family protease
MLMENRARYAEGQPSGDVETATDVALIAGLEELWAETLGDNDICVAILDGPVEQAHRSLAGANLTQLETVASGDAAQGPASRHGTHIASVIFGQQGGPVKGIAPGCRGLIVPIFKDGPDGRIAPCSQLDLARAISQAVESGAHVINISGGELSPSGSAHPILADAVQNCAANDVLIVAAAGNEGCECLHVPGALPSVLAVGAMDAQGVPLEFSNWGKHYQMQGILAHGENIQGAVPGGGTALQSGTSYATAIASGIVALLLSLQRMYGLQPSPQAVRAAILDSAYACTPQAAVDCRPFVGGRLNIPGARTMIVQRQQQDSARPRTENVLSSASSNGASTTPAVPAMPIIGDAAPDFSVRDHTGREVKLSDYRGMTVVLWFYPQADTPG